MQTQLILALLSLAVFLVPKRGKVWWALGVVGAGAAMALAAAVRTLAGAAPGGSRWEYTTLMGTEYAAMDGLSALFAIILSLGAIAALLYSKGYLRHYLDERPGAHFSLHYTALSLLFFSMLGVVTCRGGYGFLVCWELMTVCSFVLILFEGQKRETRRAAMNYLVMMHVGFVFLLTGFATLHAKGLPVSFDALRTYFAVHPPIPLFLLFLVGFGMKAGLFPLHTWLPEAHPAAPSHVSAFMSGVMIKMGVYGVLRVMTAMQTELLAAGIVLFAAGIATGVWGALLAAVQNDIKRLLAYSSIENIGVIFMALGAAMIGMHIHSSLLALCALAGALLHTFNHSFFKTLLFFGAGNIYTQTRTTSIEALGGLGKRMPLTAAMFLTATAAICALPPLSGFVSEFLIYLGLFDALGTGGGGVMAAIGGIVALSFIGGIVMIAFAKLYGVVFLGMGRTEAAAQAAEADGWRIAAGMIPVAAILAVGFAPFLFTGRAFDVAGGIAGIGHADRIYALMDRDIYTMACVLGVLLLLSLSLWGVRRLLLRGRSVAQSPTWGCGYGAPAATMQYTGESFAEGLQSISPPLAGTTAGGASVGREEIFPDERSFRVERRDRIATLFNAWWIELLRAVNSRVMKMRTGRVNYYVLYALMFLLLILILSLLGWM